jgi:bile acid:Na+ symporter, BASS family
VRTIIEISVPVLTFALLAGVGLDLRSDDFRRVHRQPALVLTGLIGPLLLLPPIAVCLTWVFQSDPHVTAGLLLVAACPIGGISNTYSFMARASTALSVTLTGLSCLLAGVTVPAVGRGLELALSQPLELTVPITTLIVQLLLMFTLPVGLGMWVRRRWPEWAETFRPLAQRLAFAGVGLMLVLIVLDNPRGFFGDLPNTVPLAAVFIVCSAATGWMAAAIVTDEPRDRFTVAAEFGTRNLGVAMAVAVTMLGRVEFARFAYTYFLTELPLMLVAAVLFRRRHGQALTVPSSRNRTNPISAPSTPDRSIGSRTL